MIHEALLRLRFFPKQLRYNGPPQGFYMLIVLVIAISKIRLVARSSRSSWARSSWAQGRASPPPKLGSVRLFHDTCSWIPNSTLEFKLSRYLGFGT